MYDVYSPTGAYMGRYSAADASAWRAAGYRSVQVGASDAQLSDWKIGGAL